MNIIKRTNGTLPVLSNALDHFFNDSFLNMPDTGFNGNFPAVNISADNDGYTLELAAPGLKKDDLKIELNKELLTISSEVREENEESHKNYTRREFRYSSFSRSFQLPENTIDESGIKANFENGVLKLDLPKREEAKPQPARMIEIS